MPFSGFSYRHAVPHDRQDLLTCADNVAPCVLARHHDVPVGKGTVIEDVLVSSVVVEGLWRQDNADLQEPSVLRQCLKFWSKVLTCGSRNQPCMTQA